MLVNVELLLSIDLVLPAAASSMDANAVFDTEVLLPSSEPSLRRSLDTVLLLTRGEVWAKLAALSIKEEDDAKADSCCTLFDSCCTDSCFWVIMLLLEDSDLLLVSVSHFLEATPKNSDCCSLLFISISHSRVRGTAVASARLGPGGWGGVTENTSRGLP